jgi:AcrR family transcriptional regulator
MTFESITGIQIRRNVLFANKMTIPTDKTALPRQRRKDARPSEIIEAALVEFAAKGYAGTKLEDVAARAKISKATIYVYFEDKRTLFEACMKSRVGPVIENAEGLIDGFPGSTEDILRLLIQTIYMGLVSSDARVLLRIIIAESENFPFLAEMHYRNTVSKGKHVMERIIARGIARGEFRNGDYAKVPMLLAGPAIMVTVWTLLFQKIDPIEIDTALEAHIDLILNGIKMK